MPTPGDWLAQTTRPAYGVLAPSDIGHALKYIAQRPVVVDNFLDDVGGAGLAFLDTVLGATRRGSPLNASPRMDQSSASSSAEF
jgi:asparagine N-glycosylation enzyme membrane subunit Stt3